VPHAGSVADNLAETHLNFGKNARRRRRWYFDEFARPTASWNPHGDLSVWSITSAYNPRVLQFGLKVLLLRDSFLSPLTAFTASGLLFRILGSQRPRLYLG
jgi:hypothetical protein